MRAKKSTQNKVNEESEVEQEEKSSPTEPISMENLEEEALEVVEPRRGQLREGVIMDINEEGLVVDIGAKRDGIILNEDFEDLDETFEIGQEIPVVVTNFRDMDGNVELSVSQARLREDWLKAEELKETEEVYETTVLGSNRGGLTIEFGRLRGFIPMSQLIGFNRIRQASERHRRLKAMVGKPIMLKVIEVNPRRRRLILSQLAAAKEWRAARRKMLLNELEAGQIRTGRLSQITDFGLFVNLGGLDGLVHISELSWGRVEDPREIYNVGQRLKVKVLSVDRERQRIALSIKALTPDPWESVPEHYQSGDLVEGKVTQIVDFGVFVELEPGVEGLLHNSELRDPEQREELEPNTSILVKVIRVEADRRRIGLSVRQVSRQEWEEWAIESTAKAEEAIEEEVEATPIDDEVDVTEESEYSDDDNEEYLDDDVIEEEATLEKAQVEA
jgi:small subunit ribosomal protein S1